MPLMLVVGGPSGSGKSPAFILSDFGVDHFKAEPLTSVPAVIFFREHFLS